MLYISYLRLAVVIRVFSRTHSTSGEEYRGVSAPGNPCRGILVQHCESVVMAGVSIRQTKSVFPRKASLALI